MHVTDTDDDGLDFWANNDGAGMARFRELSSGWLHVFEGDFGSFLHHEFRIDDQATSLNELKINFEIYVDDFLCIYR